MNLIDRLNAVADLRKAGRDSEDIILQAHLRHIARDAEKLVTALRIAKHIAHDPSVTDMIPDEQKRLRKLLG